MKKKSIAPQAPAAPKEIESTIAKEKMISLIKQHQTIVDDSIYLLERLNQDPKLDIIMCRMFGIKPQPPMPV